jgi:hypothetical protein
MTDLRKRSGRQRRELVEQSLRAFEIEKNLAKPNRSGFLVGLTTGTKNG